MAHVSSGNDSGLSADRQAGLFVTPPLWFGIFMCFALPAFLLVTVGKPVNQSGWLDPFVYAGYIFDFPNTALEYGQTYYSSRIAYILVVRFLVLALGLKAGYYASAYLALTLAALAGYALARRFLVPPLLVLSLVLFMPWILRSVLWTHYDGFAAIYLWVAIVLLVAPRRFEWATHGLAGVFWALAANCNLVLLGVGGLFFPAWLILKADRRARTLVGYAFAVVAGFCLTYGGLACIYKVMMQGSGAMLGLETWSITSWLLAGGAANWFVPISRLLENGMVIGFVPVFFIAVGVCVWLFLRPEKQDTRRLLAAALLYNLLTMFVFCALHAAFSFAIFGLFYYTIYLAPGCLFFIVALLRCAADRGEARYIALCAMLTVLVFVIWCGAMIVPVPTNWSGLVTVAFVAAAGLIALVLAFISLSASVLGLVTATYFALAGVGPVEGTHEYILNSPTARQDAAFQWDVLAGAQKFQTFIYSASGTRKPNIGFWYTGTGPEHKPFNSVQSTFLWGYSYLSGNMKLPVVDDAIKEAVLKRDLIAILAFDISEADSAVAALGAAGIQVQERARTQFQGEVWPGYTALILDVIHPSPSAVGPNGAKTVP